MSFPRYSAYKPLNLDCLQEIPESWSEKRLGSVCAFSQGKAHESYIDDNGDYICVTARFVSTNGDARKYCSRNLSPAKKNDILMVMSDLPNGRALARAFFVEDNANYAVNQRVCIISTAQVNPRFLYYQLDRNPQLIEHDDGVNQTHLSNGDFTRLLLAIPPKEEQEIIASFLDRETSKIDSLAKEQEKFIELLKEKRQAFISNAVTKGLSLDAIMKNSGVAWLGKVPTHWEVRAMRTLSSIVRGASPRPAGDPDLFGGDYVPWVTVAEITKDNRIDLLATESGLTEKGAAASRRFQAGTVVYSNSGATLGVPKILKIDACANDGVVGFEDLNVALMPAFLYYYLYSLTPTIREMVKQGSGQPNLNTEIVKSIPIALPPLPEQERIIETIQRRTQFFDDLISEAEAAVVLLHERRAALIKAAVTGQVDVRRTVIGTA